MLFPGLSAHAESLNPALQAKVTKYKQKLSEWARDPRVINAVKEANRKGGLPGMTNLKWSDLSENDPAVTPILNNEASTLIKGWVAQNKGGISKLYLRDKEANLIAADDKPVFYNNAHQPPFSMPIQGKAWADTKTKLDTTTQVNGVHVGVPVMDGGKVIGVMQTNVVAD